ncbi:ferredoxin-thioredoxin reductase catalytic domain-containing protein [Geoglobus sp.]
MTPEDHLEILVRIAERRGWKLNPDEKLVSELISGMMRNRERYGISYCPGRTVTGNLEVDRRIVCPCVYAGGDVSSYGRCYCGLFVSVDVYEGKKYPPAEIPDRHEKHITSGR